MPLFTSGGLVLVILVLVLRIWSCLHHWPMPPPLSHSVVKAGMVWHSGTASARLSWMLAIKLEWCNILFFMNKILFCAQYLLFIYVNIPWFFSCWIIPPSSNNATSKRKTRYLWGKMSSYIFSILYLAFASSAVCKVWWDYSARVISVKSLKMFLLPGAAK